MMATELKEKASPLTSEALIEDYRHGFHDSEEKYVFKSDKGLTRGDRRADLADEGRAGSGCATSASRRSRLFLS